MRKFDIHKTPERRNVKAQRSKVKDQGKLKIGKLAELWIWNFA
jgi:hypothetical protein